MLSAVNVGFYNKLIGGASLQTKLGGSANDKKIYQVKAPQGSTVPYVTFGMETEAPIGTFEDFEAVDNLTYWVNAFSSTSTANIAEIADEIMDVLDNATLTVTGYTSMKCVREFIGTIIYDMGTGIFQIPIRYRIWLDKSG